MVSEPYVTLDDLEAFMQTDLTADAQLYLDAAQEIVRGYLGQDITFVADDEEIHDGRWRLRVRLRQRPVRDVTSVTVDGTELNPDTEYRLDGAIITKTDEVPFTVGTDNIVVVYDHGWDVPGTSDVEFPVPADIRLVTLSIARRAFQNAGATDGTLSGETIGNYSYTRDAATTSQQGSLLLAESAVLDRYVIRLVP